MEIQEQVENLKGLIRGRYGVEAQVDITIRKQTPEEARLVAKRIGKDLNIIPYRKAVRNVGWYQVGPVVIQFDNKKELAKAS